ncbi:hypothetical protein B484DRAFT_456176 [Ochromonadaceae sp. CCMP2298]|nr:hypothetical protein B484DRAFT_456176 [Ochromonadaceae sp. CCMP2298]
MKLFSALTLCLAVLSNGELRHQPRNLVSRSAAKIRPYLVPVAVSAALLFNGFVTMPANAAQTPSQMVRNGMTLFRKGDVSGSIKNFDAAVKVAPTLSPYLWQRGISLYYNDDFNGCSDQFRSDVAVNPQDTEEVVWAAICDSRKAGSDFKSAQRVMLSLPSPDSRPIMRVVYSLFKGQSSSQKLALAGQSLLSDGKPNPSAQFYSNLYLGLYQEANGDLKASLESIQKAAASSYCSGPAGGDFMCSVAKNHKDLRTASAKSAAEAEAAAAKAAAEAEAAAAKAAAEKAVAEKAAAEKAAAEKFVAEKAAVAKAEVEKAAAEKAAAEQVAADKVASAAKKVAATAEQRSKSISFKILYPTL